MSHRRSRSRIARILNEEVLRRIDSISTYPQMREFAGSIRRDCTMHFVATVAYLAIYIARTRGQGFAIEFANEFELLENEERRRKPVNRHLKLREEP